MIKYKEARLTKPGISSRLWAELEAGIPKGCVGNGPEISNLCSLAHTRSIFWQSLHDLPCQSGLMGRRHRLHGFVSNHPPGCPVNVSEDVPPSTVVECIVSRDTICSFCSISEPEKQPKYIKNLLTPVPAREKTGAKWVSAAVYRQDDSWSTSPTTAIIIIT